MIKNYEKVVQIELVLHGTQNTKHRCSLKTVLHPKCHMPHSIRCWEERKKDEKERKRKKKTWKKKELRGWQGPFVISKLSGS